MKSDLIAYSKNFSSVNHHIKWKWAFRYVWIMQPNKKYHMNDIRIASVAKELPQYCRSTKDILAFC